MATISHSHADAGVVRKRGEKGEKCYSQEPDGKELFQQSGVGRNNGKTALICLHTATIFSLLSPVLFKT